MFNVPNPLNEPETAPKHGAPRAASLSLMRESPAHWVALGMGSGLAPWAPGTVGTLWAWAVFVLADRWLVQGRAVVWALIILGALALGLWACTRTAQAMRVADPSAIVWDEVIAFWLVLWLVMPASFALQLLAFVVFRFFDAVKPGPVRLADQWFKPSTGAPITWRQGLGIILDDLVAAFCTLLVVAVLTRLGFALGWSLG